MGDVPLARITSWSVGQTGAAPGISIRNETAARGAGVILGASSQAFYLHVDDGVIAASSPPASAGAADATMNLLADALEDVGFVVTDRNSADTLDKIIGYRPQRSQARLELPINRGVMLHDALDFLASVSIVCTTQLRSVVSVWIWAALLRRDALSIPQCIFGFLDRPVDCTTTW